MRRLPVIVISLGLLLVAGLAWWLMGQGSTEEPSEVARGERARDEAPVAAALPEQQVKSAEALRVAEHQAPVAAVAEEKKVPESYRRALGELTGRVITSEGAAVPGLPVSLVGGRRSLLIRGSSAFLEEGGLDFDPIAGSALTEADGRFHMRGIEPRTIGALLLDPGGPRALLWPLEVTPVSGETRDVGDIVLPATVTLRGRVVDEKGAPIVGARVRATDFPYASFAPDIAQFRAGGGFCVVDGPRDDKFAFVPPLAMSKLVSLLPVPTTSSGEDGRFELPGVTPGLVTLAVDEADHLVSMQGGVATGAAGGERDVGDVMLGAGLTVKGRVLDGAGKGVAGATVLMGNPLGVIPGAVLRGPYVTDAEGGFAARGYRTGAVWAVARADERQSWTMVTDLDAERPAEIHLPALRTLTLAVLDKLQAPIKDARIYGRVVVDDDIPDLLFRPQELTQATLNEQGQYVIGGLQPEEWEIVVKAPGRPLERESFHLEDSDTSGKIQLQDGLGLPVRVLDPSGAPVEWATVTAQKRIDFDEPAMATARTDADGRARLMDLPVGELIVVAGHPGWATGQTKTSLAEPVEGQPAAPPAEVVVNLEVGGVLVGQIFDRGGPPATPLMVVCAPDDDDTAPGDDLIPRLALSDLEGKFRFDRVSPGETHVEVRDPQTLNSGLTLFEAFIDSPLVEEKVVVEAEGETSVVLDIGAQYDGIETALLSGTITVNGLAGEGWKVRTWGEIRRSVTADASGRFDLGRIEAGDVELMLSPPASKFLEGVMQQHSVQLAAGEMKVVNISLTTASVSGRVISARNGAPVSAAQVQLRSADNSYSRSGGTISDADGYFHFSSAGAGKYRVTVRAEGFANASSETFELRPQEERSGVMVRMGSSLKVSGTIEIEGDQPNWMWLIATCEASETRDTTGVDKETRSFAFKGLAPGEWSFQLASDLDTEFEELKLSITGDTDKLVLTFKPKPPPPPEPANSEDAGH